MIERLRSRRSIRKYQDRPIEAEKVAILKEALLRSPTSRNLKPCRFIFVDDPDMLKKLSLCKPHGAAFLAGAALGIVILGDSAISDVWIEDCAIAAILVQATAQSLQLGSCWLQVRNRRYRDSDSSEAYVQQLLNIPVHVKVASIIGIGYPAESKNPIPADALTPQHIISDVWDHE
ncbi:nitroreductase family protein [Planctomycetota bacterium]